MKATFLAISHLLSYKVCLKTGPFEWVYCCSGRRPWTLAPYKYLYSYYKPVLLSLSSSNLPSDRFFHFDVHRALEHLLGLWHTQVLLYVAWLQLSCFIGYFIRLIFFISLTLYSIVSSYMCHLTVPILVELKLLLSDENNKCFQV